MPRRLHSDTGEITVANEINHVQAGARAAALDGGGYVVAVFDDSYNTYSLQRFTASGAAVGAAIPVSASFQDQSRGDVVGLDGGRFAFAWIDPAGGGTPKAKVQLYNADGSAGALITDTTAMAQSAGVVPVLGPLAGGGFVLLHEAGTFGQIAMRIYGADGLPAGPELEIQSAPSTRGKSPAVLGLPDGRFAVVWEEESFSTGTSDIKLRLFQADGIAIATTTVATGAQDQSLPQITQLATGSLLVTWQEQGAAGWDVRAGIFDSGTGLLEGSSFLVNSQTAGD